MNTPFKAQFKPAKVIIIEGSFQAGTAFEEFKRKFEDIPPSYEIKLDLFLVTYGDSDTFKFVYEQAKKDISIIWDTNSHFFKRYKDYVQGKQ